MGHGGYSSVKKLARSSALGHDHLPAHEIFKQRNVNSKMSPQDITLRESRDSKDNPNTLPIVLALDVTGSMGSIPHFLVKEGLPYMMDSIIEGGVPDPQVLFLGIGDHECDSAPLQVGQFESCDELLDHWLTNLWIEGGGGGNAGESYHLAWFFAANYTEHDHFQKRGQKGILLTIGDEPVLTSLPRLAQRAIMGEGQYGDVTTAELLDKARERYEVHHLHLLQGHAGGRQSVKDGWKQLMGDNVHFVQKREEVASVITDIVLAVDQEQKDTGYELSPPPPPPLIIDPMITINDEKETNVYDKFQGEFRKTTLDLNQLLHAKREGIDKWLPHIKTSLLLTCVDQLGAYSVTYNGNLHASMDINNIAKFIAKTLNITGNLYINSSPEAGSIKQIRE